jgi:hypothetical protein
MLNSFVVTPLDIQPAIAGLSLTKTEVTAVTKACEAIKTNLALEAQAAPEALRLKLHEAELVFNATGSSDALHGFQEAGRALAGAGESYPGTQRATALRNEAAIDELKSIALRVADDLHAKILESAARVAEAEAVAKSVFSDLSFADSFDVRLQRTLDLLAEDRLRIVNQCAALDRLCQWGLVAQNPYL